MTNVDRLLNTTAAGFIAQNLDEKDGKKDNKISASVWNDFVKDKGGKEVKEFISVEDAMKSITKYLLTEAKKLAKNVDVLAKEWGTRTKNEGSVENSPIEVGGDDEDVEETPATPLTDKTPLVTPKKDKKFSNGGKINYNSVKIKVPVQYSSPMVKSIYRSRNEGKNLSASLKKGNIKGITSDNVAYALTKDINFGPNSQVQAKFVFENLLAKMKDLGILEKNKDCKTTLAFSKLSYKQQNGLLHQYRNRIVSNENNIIRSDNTKKADFNKHRGIMQNTVNKANKLLVDVANMNPKPKIIAHDDESNGIYWKLATLPGGRYIRAEYKSNGDLEKVVILCNPRLDNDVIYDYTSDNDVEYFNDEVCYNYGDGLMDFYSFKYNDFEKIKTIAKKIFG